MCTTYVDAVGTLGIQGCAFICILDWERDQESRDWSGDDTKKTSMPWPGSDQEDGEAITEVRDLRLSLRGNLEV